MLVLRDPWRTRVLWLSIAGNLFGGALIGAHLATRPGKAAPGLEGALEHMARDLPPHDAARLRATLDRERPWFDMAKRGMGEARADLARSIAREPYDEAAIRRRMDAFQALRAETAARFGESLLAAIGTLSPEGRAKLAHAVQRKDSR